MSKTIYLSGLKYIYCGLKQVSELRESWGVYFSNLLRLPEANVNLSNWLRLPGANVYFSIGFDFQKPTTVYTAVSSPALSGTASPCVHIHMSVNHVHMSTML